jgi:hypothetical protein
MDAYLYGDALGMVESELGQTFTFAAASYPCTISARTESKTLEGGGFEPVADMVIVVRTAALGGAAAPVSKDEITVGSRVMRVDSVDHSPCGTFLVINLIDNNRGV